MSDSTHDGDTVLDGEGQPSTSSGAATPSAPPGPETQPPEGRVCPKCEQARPETEFRSAHVATHCDTCHRAKREERERLAEERRLQAAERKRQRRTNRDRRARLDIVACDVPDSCPILGRDLDFGPRSDPMSRPVRVEGEWVSTAAATLRATGVTRDELAYALEGLEDLDALGDEDE